MSTGCLHDPQLSLLWPTSGTVVVLPSLTLRADYLAKVKGIRFYEERLLFFLLTLANRSVRVVYVSSMPIAAELIDYYFSFLDDPEDARARLHQVVLDDVDTAPLTEKLLRHPECLAEIRKLTEGAGPAWIVPFNVSVFEEEVSELVGLPLYGPASALLPLGTKSGSREAAIEAGLPVVTGYADLRESSEVEDAIRNLHKPQYVLKLNDSHAGLGNAVITVADDSRPLTSFGTVFSAPGESWETFLPKMRERGVVIEELIVAEDLRSPSAVIAITPDGTVSALGTHDQILTGQSGQTYLGCSFPADEDCRAVITDYALRIGRVLAAAGVVGLLGVDFLVTSDRVFVCEVNLRLGGTTHARALASLLTGAMFDVDSGQLLADGRPVSYVATENLSTAALKGLRPAEVIEMLDVRGLTFDRQSGSGVVLHMVGCAEEQGKIGFTCIASTVDEARKLHMRVAEVFNATG